MSIPKLTIVRDGESVTKNQFFALWDQIQSSLKNILNSQMPTFSGHDCISSLMHGFWQQYKFTYNRIVHRYSFNICEIYICLFTPHGNYCLRDNISNRRYRRYAIKEFKMATKLSSGSCTEARDFEKNFDSLRLYWIENGIPSFCDKRYLNTIQRIKKHPINV